MEDNILDLDTGQEIVYSDLMLEKLDDQNKKALMEHCLTGLGMGHEEPAEGTESPESSASEKDEPGFDSERGLYILTALLEMLFPRAEKEDLAIFSFITSLKTVEWILSVVIEGSFDHDYELLVCLGLLTYLSSSGEQPKILDSIRNFLHSLRKDPKKKELKETFYLACAEAKARVKKIRNKNNATSSNVSRGVQDWLSAFLSEEKEKLRERIFGESLKGRDIDVVSLVVSCSTGMPREIAATPTLEFFLEHSSPGNGIKLSPDQIATILPIAELLLTNGADPNASIRDGKSPLWKHIVDKDVISLLLKYGAKLGSCGPRFFSKVLKAGDNDVAEVLWLHGMSLDTAPQGDVVCKSLPPTVPSHFFSPAMWTPARHIKFPKWFRLTIETTLLCWRRQSLRFQHNQVLCYRSRSEVTQSQDYTNSEPQETARKRPRIGPPEANKRPEMPVSVPRDGAEPFHPVGVLPKCVLLSCICTLLSPAHFSVLYY
ncbi:hypothetical protein Pelo_2325 [Pelomyxa schiedti]|nr:hypothetical protein Pelo_2325 [Pelomyxa schiedti]